MDNRKAFEKLQKSIPPWIVFDDANGSYRLAEQALNSNARHELINSYNREWWIFQSAVEHCKQGEQKPVAKVIHDGSYHGIMHVRITNYKALQHGMDLFAHAMPKSDSDPYRAKAVEILELDMEEFGDDKAINLTGLWKLLCGDDGYLAIPNDQYFSVIESTPQPSTDVSELLDAMNEVIRISDRDHDAWNKVKALIAKHTVK